MTALVEITPVHLAAAKMNLIARNKSSHRFTRLPLYPKQAAIVDDPARFTMCEATTKAGKTMSHLEWLLECACAAGQGNWWWVAPINTQADMALRRAEWRLRGYLEQPTGNDTFERVRLTGIEPIPFKTNLTKHSIEVNGAVIWFKSAEEPDSLYGEDVRGAVGDEVTRWRESAFDALYTTLTATKGRAKFIGNVKGRQNWAYKKARKAEAGESGWGYHKLTALDAIDAGIMDRATFEDAQRDLTVDTFKQLYLAEAADDEGNPFGIEYIRACVGPLSEQHPVAWGVDLAKSVDWTVAIALDTKGRVAAFRRFQMPWEETTAELGRIVKQSALVDSTGVGDPILERLQRVGNFEGYKFTSQSKQQLMEGLAVAIQQREITFPDGPIRAELEAFEYEYTAHGVRYSAPEGMHDDCVCALALAVHCWRNHRGIRLSDIMGEGEADDYYEPADRGAWELR